LNMFYELRPKFPRRPIFFLPKYPVWIL